MDAIVIHLRTFVSDVWYYPRVYNHVFVQVRVHNIFCTEAEFRVISDTTL